MAIKSLRTCDVTGAVIGPDEGPVCGAHIHIVVPHAESPKELVISAEHLDPELAELLLKACVNVLTRRGLYVYSNGVVRTEPEVIVEAPRITTNVGAARND